ncbi:MAG TPA: hypothetical protein PLI43_02285 [Albidovulum sp.]|uniref:hypothetical protein n=1 Tax=Albidovulum sp. TaxID=1872424 RepID=UPI002CE6629C|nr:hypothetical protein [Albidovulum sp.]
MPESKDKPVRMLVSVPFGGENASRAAERFRARGLQVAEVMDLIGSLVVVGTEPAVRAAAGAIPDVIGCEPEQVVRTQG